MTLTQIYYKHISIYRMNRDLKRVSRIISKLRFRMNEHQYNELELNDIKTTINELSEGVEQLKEAIILSKKRLSSNWSRKDMEQTCIVSHVADKVVDYFEMFKNEL